MFKNLLNKHFRKYLLILAFIGILALGAFEIKYSSRFYPGIFVAGESVGGQTYAEALSHFKEKADALQKNGLNLNFESAKGIRKVNVPTNATGLTSDNSIEYFSINNWENDLQSAYKWGHGINIFRDLGEQFLLIFIKKRFVFSATIQNEAVNSLLDNEFYNFFEKSAPAEFLSTNNTISIVKEKTGEVIEKEEILNVLQKKLALLDLTDAVFKAHADVPKVAVIDLQPFLDFAGNFAKETNLIFQYQGHTWKITGSKLVTWLTIKKEGGIGIDSAKLEDYLTNTVAKFIDNPPQNSRFEIQNGKLVEITAGKSGNIVDIEKAMQQIEKIIPENVKNFNLKTGAIYIPIETTEVEPRITKKTIDEYQIKDMVGEISTSFDGSTAGREHNIKVGIATITGILIAPGEEFSTETAIGSVTEKEGYVKEMVIKENKTTKEYGGGLCQVATTLFRLALNAGLPITERTNHRFVVHYYDPPGLDATIYAPHPDLRFVNDTDNYLLLQARVENKKVIMELYGQKDGRSSEISKPVVSNMIPAPATKYIKSADLPIGQTTCTEAPHDGLTTDVLYTVNYPDGTVKKKNFQSIYQPWQKICLVGTSY